jgi:hypothetical protein
MRSGFAEATFRELSRIGLLKVVTPELEARADAAWESLARLDRYRQRFPSAPPALTNTVLIGALLSPIGAIRLRPGARVDARADRIKFGILPVARKDLERLLQIMQMLPRLLDPGLPPRAVRSMMLRPAFADALVWLEVFGDEAEAADALERWKEAQRQQSPGPAEDGEPLTPGEEPEALRPRRRRRRRRRRGPGTTPTE